MRKPDRLGAIVAKRDLVCPTDVRKRITIRIGKPVLPKGERSYVCPYRILGIGADQVRHAPGGMDSVHSLQLALQKIGIELYVINKCYGGSLHWEGGAEGDVGFPLLEAIERELK